MKAAVVVVLLLIFVALLGAAWFFLWPKSPCTHDCYIESEDASIEDYRRCGIYLFDASDPDPVAVQAAEAMQAKNYGPNSRGSWTDDHYALLFFPGDHTKTFAQLRVGYYTHVAGLGSDATLVTIPAVCLGNGSNALDTFWRIAENFTFKPMDPETADPKGEFHVKDGLPSAFGGLFSTWAVSQAAPLRRCCVTKLALATLCQIKDKTGACFASGGFSADNQYTDLVTYASQQQWMALCDIFDTTQQTTDSHAVWNAVFVGCSNAPSPSGKRDCGRTPSGILTNVTLPTTFPIARASKPFLQVRDPKAKVRRLGVTVPTTSAPATAGAGEPEPFVVAFDEGSLQAALSHGKTRIVVASARPILLSRALKVVAPDTLLLGVGVPTLRLSAGASVDVLGDGCCLAGLMIEPGALGIDALLTWSGTHGRAYDLYTRVGGSLDCMSVGCNTQLRVATGASLLAENLWLWRADHDIGPSNVSCEPKLVGGTDANKCDVGLEVQPGAALYCLGLASEHNLQQNVSWKGSGEVYFYQSELVYCPPIGFNQPGFSVETGATFKGRGMGVYSFFPVEQNAPMVTSGFTSADNADVDGLVTVFLDGYGGIAHVYNTTGCQVDKNHRNPAVYLVNAPVECPPGSASSPKRLS